MKKIALSCVVVSILFTKSVNAQECQVLRVGGNIDWLPVTYINQETQELEGIALDLVLFIGEKLGVPVNIDAELPWKRMLFYLARGNLDLGAAIYRTKEREELYQYTASYFMNEARVFVLKGKEFPFEQFEDLIGRTGAIPSGGSFGDKFDTFAKEHALKVIGVATKKQRVGMLLRGRTDYFIQDYLDGMMYLKLNGLQDKVVALPYPVSTTNIYFAMSRQSPCMQLVPQINEIINKAKQDGTLQVIIEKYIK